MPHFIWVGKNGVTHKLVGVLVILDQMHLNRAREEENGGGKKGNRGVRRHEEIDKRMTREG